MSAPRPIGRVTARHVALLAVSFGTMVYAGIVMSGSYATWAWVRSLGLPLAPEHSLWGMPAVWLPGVGYAVSFMAILFAHEMGHYLTARRHDVPASFPYFIPFFPPLGSLGAVIGMVARPMPSRSLMRVAAFGPFAGMIVAVPVVVVGLLLSDVRPVTGDFEGLRLGGCLLFNGVQRLIFGDVPAGHDVFLHPVALAGWAGCLITGLNLLPFGQLDGGHVMYALLGERFNRIVGPLFVVTGLVLVAVNPGFIVYALLLVFLVKLRHPALSTDGVATGADRWVGRAAIVLFIVTFTPRPVIQSWPSFLAQWAALFGVGDANPL